MKTRALITAITLVICSNAKAASTVYYLDQSNVLADGVGYLKVTIADSTVNLGDIDFLVETTSALSAGSNFGIQSFGFNPSLTISSANIYNLNSMWKIGSGVVGGFGSFSVTESGTGNARLNPLRFSIRADGDSIASYANPSSGVASSWIGMTNPYFVAHVAGFSETSGVTSAYFAGNTEEKLPPNAVPVPAAAWLLGSGLIGLVGVSRRQVA